MDVWIDGPIIRTQKRKADLVFDRLNEKLNFDA